MKTQTKEQSQFMPTLNKLARIIKLKEKHLIKPKATIE